MKRYYITTPIYYVNSDPHVGTALTTILADAAKRFQLSQGREVMFLTGTDDNAQKNVEVAEALGLTAEAYTAQMADKFRKVWGDLDVSFDRFIRTTEESHHRTVQKVFNQLRDQGDIYQGVYEGWYCVSDETFFPPAKVGEDRLCPNPECRRPLEHRQEESYFFRLSAYGDRLTEYIRSHPEFVQPDARRNEVLRFIEEGLIDTAVSRKDGSWGVPIPGEPGKVVYVWFDALINYLSATGWADGGDAWQEIWPPDLQLMAKDILPRFHGTIWPAMLMALDLPLPRQLFCHGWFLMEGEKISKSKGNAVHPEKAIGDLMALSGCERRFAVDALRYYLLRETPIDSDGNFTIAGLHHRYNSDLANDLGNLTHRTLSMTHRYLEGKAPQAAVAPVIAEKMKEAAEQTREAYEKCDFPRGLSAAWELIRAVNLYYDAEAPWNLAKNGDLAGAGAVLYSGLEACRALSILARPVCPNAAVEIARQLDVPHDAPWEDASKVGWIPAGHSVQSPMPIFPRIDPNRKTEAPQEPAKEAKMSNEITLDDFKRVQLRIATIKAAEPVPNADKLLKLTLTLGDEERQIVSGIAEEYAPDQLVGRQIAVVTNLKPATIRGVVSDGMLLAADVDGKAILLSPDSNVPDGSPVR
ncbi:MAG: methionine--tRNA ligase [Armatimonadetes bacterium]|nr:methionine--tRNA ligase [Armatimonadota bacterium]